MIELFRDTFRSLRSARFLTLWVSVALILAAAGPFGTFESLRFGQSLIYWGLVVGVSSSFGRFALLLSRKLFGEFQPVKSDLVMVAFMTIVFTPVLWMLTRLWMGPVGADGVGYGVMSLYAALITTGICIFRRLTPGVEKVGYFSTPAEMMIDVPRLYHRLPDGFDGMILRLTVRDHFVDVVSSSGTHSIRMRFVDAIEEMDSVEGYCTHRSHWVSKDAIVGVERENGKLFLRLVNDDLVPVSRKYRPELEAAAIV